MNAPASPQQLSSLERAERQAQVVRALEAVLPGHALLWNREDTTPYECDGLTAYRERPLVVALPETYAQVQAVLKACHALDVPVVARGAGTGLSGGAMPHTLGVTLSLAKFNKILKIDAASRTAVVQGGVRNLAISEAAAPLRPVLRARPVEPDRLHHRRQRGRELGRRALPEVRPDAAQRAQGQGLHDRGRRGRVRRRRAGQRRLRPAGRRHRQRGHAGRDHRSHRQADAQAAAGALHHGQLRRPAQGRRCGGGGDCRGHHPGRAGDDGQADDGGGRGLRARRLRPERRGDSAVRKRRHARRSRGRNRPHERGAARAMAPRPSR